MKLDTDTMTAIERVKATVQHEEPDRVPVYLMGIPVYSRTYIEWHAREDEIMDSWTENDDNVLLTPLGDFTLRYFFGTDVETRGVGIAANYKTQYLDAGGHLTEDASSQEGLPERTTVDYLGSIHKSVRRVGHANTSYDYSWYHDGFLKTKDAVLAWYDRYGWPDEQKISSIDIATYKAFDAQFGDRICIIPQIGGMQLYESSWPIMGLSRWSYYCQKDPAFISRIIESRKNAQLRILDELAKLHPFVVFGGDDMGQKDRPLMSPAAFRKFLFQPYKEVFDKIHAMGAVAFNHSCGNIMELLPAYIEAGINGWQSLEPASGIDHALLKKQYGDKLLLVGGIDSSGELCFGTPKSIEAHVKKQLTAMAPRGGYIAGPAHDYLNVPLENALAMRDALQKWGRYPIKN